MDGYAVFASFQDDVFEAHLVEGFGHFLMIFFSCQVFGFFFVGEDIVDQGQDFFEVGKGEFSKGGDLGVGADDGAGLFGGFYELDDGVFLV